jgi:hypothetical protein
MNTEIIEGNKLIAEFDGWRKSPYSNTPNKMYKGEGKTEVGIHVDQLKYHSSWDSLMPVIAKINLIYEAGIKEEYVRVLWDEIHCMLSKLNILRTNAAIVQFIQWYNTQTKQK